MKLTVLGSSAAAPTKKRNCSSFLLHIESYSILFDCAEGTQRQLVNAGLKLSKIRFIFISHLHADHIFGLIPLLSTKSMFNIPGKITIIGPVGLKSYIEFNLNISGSKLSYEYEIIEIYENKEFEFKNFKLNVFLLNHRIASFGARISFYPKPGNLIKEKLDFFGIEEGPLCGKLKRGETLILENGQSITKDDVSTPDVPGKIFAFVPDTYLCENIYKVADNADFLLIESTFQKEHFQRAKDRNHLTSYMCGDIAVKSRVKEICLFHFSASYTNLNRFREDAAENFKSKIHLAVDLKEIDL